jgi:serine/threonine-protein kinase
MADALESSRTGDLLNGIYELHEALATGADSDTYRATDTRRGSSVQVTLLKAELALRAGAVERFLELPRALSGLRHPHVAQTLGIELDETGIPFVVQEDVKGEPLAKALAGFPQGMPLGVAVAVLSPVIDAVAAAHALSLVHGRLGREQIQLVRTAGSSVPKLSGFGRAPEGVDATSDVWALGAL